MAETSGAHLDEETWERLACHELTPFERDRALDHVTRCALCADVYRGVSMLEEEARAFDAAVPGAPATERRSFGWSPRVVVRYALAAALLLLAIGLGVWTESLRRQNVQLAASLDEQRERAVRAETASARPSEDTRLQAARIAELQQTVAGLTQPQLNVPIVNLEPRDALRGTPGGRTNVIDIPPEAGLSMLVLHVSTDRTHPSYTAEILNSRNNVVWVGEGLRKTSYNTFSLALPREFVPVGGYRIRLYGGRGDTRELVEQYTVEVRQTR